MSAPSFDSAHAVRFDLAHGTVRAGNGDDRLLLVPLAALVDLARSAPSSAVEALGRALGSAIGRRAATRIDDAKGSSLEEFITQLAGEAAMAGVGSWSVERWGRALVVVVDDAPALTALIGPLVSSALETATDRKVAYAVLSSDEHTARILVSSDRAVERVRQWMSAGASWGDAITKLHGGTS